MAFCLKKVCKGFAKDLQDLCKTLKAPVARLCPCLKI